MGATVVVHGRSPGRVDAVCRIISERTSSHDVTGMAADFASLEEVRRLATTFAQRHPRLDVLIDNAGGASSAYRKTADGFEWHFGVNHLAPFLLTNLLLDRLVAGAPSRIVVVSSEAHRRNPVDLTDLNLERGYGAFRAYGRSKFANISFVVELARRLQGTGVTINALHPGFVNTNLFAGITGLPRFLFGLMRSLALSPEEGAKTSIYLASSSEVAVITGKYFSKCREAAPSQAALDPSLARQLWEKSEALTGLGGPTA
jgi:NAD(P)-dependent dehydrogenase (short-subunit alcohol dehydrogenase family)